VLRGEDTDSILDIWCPPLEAKRVSQPRYKTACLSGKSGKRAQPLNQPLKSHPALKGKKLHWIHSFECILIHDGILGHQFKKDSSLLLHAIHSPFYWKILKKTILFSGFKNHYKKNLQNKKTRVYS
jgi:hypothetical protein